MKNFIPFSIGDRKIEVLLKKIGKSPVKTLTELITNSDDSYKRLLVCNDCLKRYPEKEYRNKLCPECNTELSELSGEILIIYNYPERQFQVIDHAEGLTDAEMEEKFNEFGEDIAGRTAQTLERGLFKQGLAQVLFTQEYGNVRSIKDDESYICKYVKQRKKGQKKKKIGFQIAKGPRITKELRNAWKIPEGNGTLVEFMLIKDTKKPNPDKLYEKLCNFFMLRKILSDPKREVKYIVIDSNGKITTNILKTNEPKGGKLLSEFTALMEYEKYPPIKIDGEVYENPNPLVQYEKGIEEREGGLLIFDDKDRVYELSLFKYDKWQESRHLYGSIRLYGAYEIIKDRLDNHYEEIVLESRDGFNPKHDFYKQLSDIIEEKLEPTILDLRKQKRTDKDTLSVESKERQAKAFKILNKLYKDLTENVIDVGPEGEKERPPKNGIEFVRSQIKTTVGKKYLIYLRIDTDIIPPNSKVNLKSDNSLIKVKPQDFSVQKNKEKIVSKVIQIVGEKEQVVGVVSAETGGKKAELVVHVVKEIIHKPEGSMEFFPDNYYFYSGRRSYLNLYIDTSQIPVGNTIDFNCDNTNFILELTAITIKDDHKIDDDIAKMKVPITGHGINNEGKIEASCFNLSVIANAKIVSKEPPKPPKDGGKFSGKWHYEELSRDIRTEYDAATGDILINKNHPVNKEYFGRSAQKSYELYVHCQIYLAELILDECLSVAVGEAYGEGKLEERLEPATDIKNYIEGIRFKIGKPIHKYFVKPDSLKKIIKDV